MTCEYTFYWDNIKVRHVCSLTVSVEQFSTELQSFGEFTLLPREDHVWRSCCDEIGSFTPVYTLPGLNNHATSYVSIQRFKFNLCTKLEYRIKHMRIKFQIMCLEESFCPFTRDALNFRQLKIYAVPQCPGFPSPSAVITAQCEAPLYHSAQLPLMLTGKAESAQITLRQEMSNVTLVYLLLCCEWHAVQLIWATLVKSSFTVLITFVDNTCLLDVSLHRIIIYINFPLIYAIWWPLTHITWSYLCMNGWETHVFLYPTHTHTHTHTHTESHVKSQ